MSYRPTVLAHAHLMKTKCGNPTCGLVHWIVVEPGSNEGVDLKKWLEKEHVTKGGVVA